MTGETQETHWISHPEDFRNSIYERVFRIMTEFIDGWKFLSGFKKTVTIFGSNRVTEKNKWYIEAQKLGRKLAEAGYGVVTGGGNGIMEAGNRGALEAAAEAEGLGKNDATGQSIGLHILLPQETSRNKFVRLSRDFHYFFIRKVMLSYHRDAYVYFPGGFGTLDELFEILTLIQTKKLNPVPVILVGREYWTPLFEWMVKEVYEKFRGVDKNDLDIPVIVDDADEAYQAIVSLNGKNAENRQ